MDWVFLLAASVYLAAALVSHAASKNRAELIQSLDRHTAEVKRQNQMLAKADRIVVASVRGSEEQSRASFN